MSGTGAAVDPDYDSSVGEDIDSELPNDREEFLDRPTDEQSDEFVEARAVRMGWRPYDRFTGDKAKWTPAREWLTRAEELLPIAQQMNHGLEKKLVQQERIIQNLERTSSEAALALKDMRERSLQAEARGYKRAMDEIEAKKRQAVADGDQPTYDALVEDEKKLKADHAAAQPSAPAATPPPQQPAPPQADPAIQQFVQANPWFNANPQLTDSMVYHHRNVMREGSVTDMADQLEEAKARVQREFPESFGMRHTQSPQQQQPRRPRVQTVQAPADRQQRAPSGNGLTINAIADPAERESARREFNRFKHQFGAGYTEAEYMEVYGDPHADVLAIQQKYRGNK